MLSVLYRKIMWWLQTGRWPREVALTPKGVEWAKSIRDGATIETDENGKLILVPSSKSE